MKILCATTSRVPSSTANSIQAMKACHALAVLGHEVRLLLPAGSFPPGQPPSWPSLAAHYGLNQAFQIEGRKTWPVLKRYDLAWDAVQQARRWGAVSERQSLWV